MIKSITYILSLILVIGLTSCQDDYFNRLFEHDGDDVLLSIDYMPASSASVKTRASDGAPGDGMQDINDLCLVFFDEDGKFAGIMDISDNEMFPYTESWPGRTEEDTSNGQVTSEDKTIRREYHLNLPLKKLYIYAVANMGTSTYDTLEELGVDDMSREEFRQIRRTWDTGDYSKNSEMSGICTIGKLQGKEVYTGMKENPVTVKPGISLHCWLRRLSSKVTVDFDATHLDPSTTIYLKEIRVKDVAYDCSLVAPNTAEEKKNTEHGIIAESSDFIRLCGDKYIDDENNNFVNWPYLTAGIPTLSDLVNSFDAYTPAPVMDQKEKLKSIGHLNSSPCIFFYENMQGVHADKPKLQDIDGKDSKGNFTYESDGVIDSPNSYLPTDPDYKDRVRAGTYVEVEAYYQSVAAGNEGQGRIIYRFMLGKNEIDNYDVERNYHYKLTLCFMGYANDVDWHIEYDIDRPPYSMPDEYFISYGYNEMLEYPISITGELVDGIITAEIVRNDWGPSRMWVDERPWTSTTNAADTYLPYVADSKVAYPEGDIKKVSLGFLSLRKPQNDVIGASKTANSTESHSYIWTAWNGGTLDDGDKSRTEHITDQNSDVSTLLYDTNIDELDDWETLYKGKRSLGYRVYKFDDLSDKPSGDYSYGSGVRAEYDDKEDGGFRVYTKQPSSNSYPRESTYYIPLYTRERNICTKTGFTGENPYNNYQRRAKVIFRFKVKRKDSNGVETTIPCQKEVPIIQTTKIGNPMGIWRAWNNAAPFDVQMKYINEDGATYSDLTSHEGGWSAEVEQGADWILLNGGRRKVTGEKGSKIHFSYRPIGILSNPNQVRCGIITVRYHNFACIHKIFVRQGYAPLKIYPGGVYFHTGNLVTANTEADNPCDEGSMFRAGNLDDPIHADNNNNDEGFILGKVTPVMFKDHSNTEFKIAGKKTEDGKDVYKKWSEIQTKGEIYETRGGNLGWPEKIIINDTECEIMNITNVSNLRGGMDSDTERIRYQYGVLYSDKATSTANTTDAAYHYRQSDPNSHSYGMRGCFIYNNTDGRQLFFPIGYSGYGRRKSTGVDLFSEVPNEKGWATYPEVGTAVLRYASRITYMTSTGDKYYMPLLWDIFRSDGANYWCHKIEDDQLMGVDRTSLDLNYKTFDFSTLGEEVFVGKASKNIYGSDALFIRLVQHTPPSSSN